MVVNADVDEAYQDLKKCIIEGKLEEVGNVVPEMKEDPVQVAKEA